MVFCATELGVNTFASLTWLEEGIRPRVHGYLATAIRNLDSPWVVVGGVADHVHILFDMGKLVAPVKFVEQVKRESSKFVKTLGASYTNFYWRARLRYVFGQSKRPR